MLYCFQLWRGPCDNFCYLGHTKNPDDDDDDDDDTNFIIYINMHVCDYI